ncbi:MAG: DNA primase, partial [Planctomycetes bacterium]|nr:DNA primase [Planctomycetota bacterium]
MALYSQDFLERVRSANELSQVVGSYNVQLKRAGSNLLGLCPFHNEKTPSFNIRPAEQFFRCFGCGAKGDVFRFVQMMERIEFPEAVKILAERAGLQLEFESPAAARQAVKQSETKSALLWCTSRALDYYEENLYKPNGAAALEYLLNRGFTRETITRWRLGWAPDSWDGLCGFLLKNAKDSQQKEKVMEYARQAGVVRAKEMERGSVRYYDAFRGRVMFPITDIQARPIAFGGRLLEEKPDAGGKYINSSEGRLFEKRKVLFGLSQAAKEIALTGKAVVVEGYTDVVMCHQYGIKNVVATLGTSLTEDHIALLRRHVSAKGGVVAFFDSDAAGEKATRRAIGLFMAEDVPLLVAGGLEPKDAADYLPVHGSERFSRHIEMAEDGFIHVLNRTIGAAKGRDVGALGNAVREVMELVNTCPDAVKRAIMRHRVAAEAGVPEETLPKPAEKAAAFPGRVAARPEARPSVKRGLSHSPAVMGFDAALHQGADGKRKREM